MPGRSGRIRGQVFRLRPSDASANYVDLVANATGANTLTFPAKTANVSTSPVRVNVTAIGTTNLALDTTATYVEIEAQGPGGGGGSGRCSSGGGRSGGGGGGGGANTQGRFMISDLVALGSSTMNITIPPGGAGGIAVSANNTNGVSGSLAGNTTITINGQSVISAQAGSPGAGGTSSTASGGTGGLNGTFPGAAGGSSSTAAGSTGTNALQAAGGGGAGAGANGSTPAAGGQAGYGNLLRIVTSAIAAGGAATGAAGGNAVGPTGGALVPGSGGGGGGSSGGSTAGAGGNGINGGGGGGGATSGTSGSSGAGGAGGAGYVTLTYFY